MNKLIKILYFASICLNFSCTKKFLFSVIISIYNNGRYLDDSIGSVLNQTIQQNNIQIILVNDGSIDETEEICLKYQDKFPKNIKYIKIKHSGVSVGRNIGMKYAEGEFINFLDADDKWDKEAFKLVFLFFRFNKDINIVGCRMVFFEAFNSYHPLDYKFSKSRKVDLNKEYNCIHLSSSSSFFRYSLIKDQKFKEKIFNGEDTLFINNLLLIKPSMGLVREAIYYYRKRRDSTSAIQNKVNKEEYYSFVIKSVDQYLLEKSKKMYKRILPFIQYYIAYNTLFRIILPSHLYLESSKFISYCKLIESNIKQVEDKYFLEQRILSLKEKLLVLSKKYGKDIRKDIKFNNGFLTYSGIKLINLEKNTNILIWIILEIKNNILHLEGRDNFFLSPNTYYYYTKFGNKIKYPEYYDYSGFDTITMYGKIYKGRIVVFDIPIEEVNFQIVKFFMSFQGVDFEIFPILGTFSPIPNIPGGYYHHKNHILKIIDKRINIYKYNKKLEEIFENYYCEQLKIINKGNLIEFRNNSITYRSENNTKKNIWLINDKLSSAGDNGEYFFRFLKKKDPPNIIYFFVIKNNCTDSKRLKPLGNILEYGSEKHLDILLKSDKILSSVYEEWARYPFNEEYKYIKDLIQADFIFIQHGIIKDELSYYINKIRKNYNLNKNNVIITGLPRFDYLQNQKNYIYKEKIILILPTWRKYIKGTYDSKTYESIHSITFNETTFFNFYNNLINNDKLIKNMEKYNYTGIFCLHPYFSEQWIDFRQNKIFSVVKVCDYQNILLRSSLLVTDYSSIFFDFVYLKKPIVYTHFDYEKYRYEHFSKGYFDYERHGFGPVCYNFNCTINNIISQIKKNCSLEKKYLKRVQKFFKYNDENSCERLFLALLSGSYKLISENNSSFMKIIVIFLMLILIKFNNMIKIINIYIYYQKY